MFPHVVRLPSRFLRGIPLGILTLAVILSVDQGCLRGQNLGPLPPAAAAREAALQRAQDCFKQGKYQEAADLYRQFDVLYPADSRGLMGVAASYLALGRKSEAIQFVQDEVAKQPYQRSLRLFLANLQLRAEQYDAAIDELQKLLPAASIPNERATLLFQLGNAYHRKGDLDEAIHFFQAASSETPDSISPLLEEALIFDRAGRLDEAKDLYEQILAIQPKNASALNNLGYMLAEHGDPDGALELALRAIEAQPNSPEMQDTLGWAYVKRKQYPDAIAAFRAALKAQPDNGLFHYHLGVALLESGQRDAAIQELRTALTDHPQEEPEIRKLLDTVTN